MKKFFGVLAMIVVGQSLVFAQSASPAPSITAEEKEDVLKAIQRTIDQRAFVPGVDFGQWPKYVEARKADIDAATTPVAFMGQVNRAFREFGFSHIRLSFDSRRPRLNPRATPPTEEKPTEAPKLQLPTFLQTAPPTGQRLLMGVTGSFLPEGMLIESVMPGSAAAEAGLKPGELILTINGEKPTSSEALAKMPAERTLSVKGTDGKVREVKLTAKMMTPTVATSETLTMVGDDTALFRVMTFSDGYSRTNVVKLLTEAKDKKFMILDLRSNGGGDASNLAHLLSHLMPENTIYGTFVNKTMANRYKEANPEGPVTAEAIAKWTTDHLRTRKRDLPYYKGKIAVLINRGTGSAAEITAASLQETMGSKVIGTPSAGAVLASIFMPVNNGFQLQFPISDYVTAKGVRLEGNPVKPDVVINARRQGTVDPVVDKALEVLRGVPAESAPK
jgi:carboxyl-terminal processing protease